MKRKQLLEFLTITLKPHPKVLACWLEGADAENRADAYSDIDLWLAAEDGYEGQVLEFVRGQLEQLGELDLNHTRGEHAPGVWQGFLRLKDTSEFLVLDLNVQSQTRDVTLNPAADAAKILFDRAGIVQFAAQPLDALDLTTEKKELVAAFEVYQLWVKKELARGHFPEALRYYHHYTLEPLVKLLRLNHTPAKRDFGLKHLRYDLPGDVFERLETLYRVADLGGLELSHQKAISWLKELNS